MDTAAAASTGPPLIRLFTASTSSARTDESVATMTNVSRMSSTRIGGRRWPAAAGEISAVSLHLAYPERSAGSARRLHREFLVFDSYLPSV